MTSQKGFGAAALCAAAYMGVYAVAGMVLVPAGSAIAGPSEVGDLTGYYIVAHFISAAVLWLPSALVAWMLQERVGPAPGLSLWVAGILAVPVVWGGSLLCANYFDEGTGSILILSGTAAILLCNLTLAAAWLIPPRKTRSHAA